MPSLASPSRCALFLLRKARIWKTAASAAAASDARRMSSVSADADEKSRRSRRARELDKMGAWDTWDPSLSMLPAPIQAEASIERGTIIPSMDATTAGVCTSMGRRNYQEDRYTIKEPMKNVLLIAVWDGHGGADCADFCSEHVETYLERNFKKLQEEADASGSDGARVSLRAVLRNTILDLNKSFELHWNAVGRGRSSSPGTTATIALIRDGYEMAIAQVGDSVALLCRGGDVRRLTREHCPSVNEERERIEAAGGTVSWDAVGRHMVNGRLSMSRSIGDLDLKPYGVIADPELSRDRLKHGKDKFLVLATDGVTFVLTDDEIVDCVSSCETPGEAAEKLIDQALHFSTEDNVTAVVLPLGAWWKSTERSKTNVFYSLGRNMARTSRFS